MIAPTVGRVVWYRPNEDERSRMTVQGNQPLKADVVCVWHDRLVNLFVVDHAGMTYARPLVHLRQDDEKAPQGSYCEWPYQKGQAAKAEALEKQLERK